MWDHWVTWTGLDFSESKKFLRVRLIKRDKLGDYYNSSSEIKINVQNKKVRIYLGILMRCNKQGMNVKQKQILRMTHKY